MAGTPEKRRAPRQKVNSVLELYDHGGHLIVGVGRLLDYSAVGACFVTTQPLKVGAAVRARLRLPGQNIVEMDAKVVWTRLKAGSSLYGVEFNSRL